MNRLAFLSAFLFLPIAASAQQGTLLGDDIEHGGYGGAVVKVTPINGSTALMLGAEAVWIVDKTLYVGVQGASIFNKVEANTTQLDGEPYLLWVNETGVRAGYIHHYNELVHLTGGALIGAGSLQLADRYFWTDPSRVSTHDGQTYYFLLEPEVGAELNVASWMRARLGASYRIVSAANEQGMTNGDLSGPAGSLTLMFGWF